MGSFFVFYDMENMVRKKRLLAKWRIKVDDLL